MRYYFCVLENSKGKKETAYIKFQDAVIGKTIYTNDDPWKIVEVSEVSTSKEFIENLETSTKVSYKKEK